LPKKLLKKENELGKAFWERLREVIGNEKPYAWAVRVGIPKSSFANYAAKNTIPTAEHLVNISNSTGLSIDWLLTGKKLHSTDELQGIRKDSPIYDVVKVMKEMPKSKLDLVRDIINRVSEEGK
jgi:hypothetical protein